MHAFADWTARHWVTALVAAGLVTLAVGIPSDVIPNPVFARPTTPVAWWAYPVLGVTAALGGLLAATYVRRPTSPGNAPGDADDLDDLDELDRPGQLGGAAGLLSFFAIGCPTCNKLVVVAVGSSGALDWFAPAQPMLAVGSVGLLGWALRARLRAADECRIPERDPASDIMAP